MQKQFLLLEDIHGLGKKGEVLKVRPGYARNFLLPKGKIVIADAGTLRLQERLRKEREEQAAADRKASLELAKKLQSFAMTIEVKVDPEGHLYGSIQRHELVKRLNDGGFEVESHSVLLPQPIKALGNHKIQLKLKEDVEAWFALSIVAEGAVAEEQGV